MLIPCLECRREVSSEAQACPGCGVPSPMELIERKLRRPYEESAQQLLKEPEVWVKFAAPPCTCWKVTGREYNVLGKILSAEVKPTKGGLGRGYWRWEDWEDMPRYIGGPKYYIEFTVRCKTCKMGYLGSRIPSAARYDWYPGGYPHSFRTAHEEYKHLVENSVLPAPGAPQFVYVIKFWRRRYPGLNSFYWHPEWEWEW